MDDNIPRFCSNRFLRLVEYMYIMHTLGHTDKCRPWATQVLHKIALKHRQFISEGC